MGLGESCTEILLYNPAKEGQIPMWKSLVCYTKAIWDQQINMNEKTEVIPGLGCNRTFIRTLISAGQAHLLNERYLKLL